MADEQTTEQSTQSQASQPPGDALSGLRSALQSERTRANTLQGELNQLRSTFDGIDPQAARDALTRLPQLETQLNSTQIENAANRVLSQVIPEYRDLFRSSVHSQLSVENGQVVTADGRSLDQVASDLRTRYPQMFAAPSAPTGSGATPSTSSAPPPASVVSAPGGIISGVNPQDVIGGKVKLKTD